MNPFTFHTTYSYEPHTDTKGVVQNHGPCPFCGKEKDHFSFNNDFLWNCKHCSREGNLYNFLQQFHSELCTQGPVAELAVSRQIPLSYFKLSEIKFNPLASRPGLPVYVIPTFNKEGHLNNLYKVCIRERKQHQEDSNRNSGSISNSTDNLSDPDNILYHSNSSSNNHFSLASQSLDRLSYNILCTPTLEATLFNLPQKTEKEVWLCEGHMDKLAGEAIVGPARSITCIGYPGSTFKQPWVNILSGVDLVIFSDNDPGGETNYQLIIKRIQNSPAKPRSIRRIVFPPRLPKGYDLNDIWIDHVQASFQYIQDNLVTVLTTEDSILTTNTPVNADVSCNSFEMLISECSTAYHFTRDMELLLLAMFSAVYSLKIEGEQLWFRVIGPPGSSKTTLATVTGSSEQTIVQSTFTGLFSGWKDEQEGDASLIPLIAGKALIVKDADALLQQPNVAQIMSELRDFYDKNTAVTYRNRVSFDYKNIRSSFIFCGTTALRGIDNAALGERFLDFELHVSDSDRKAMTLRRLKRAREEGATGISPENKVWDKSRGFIDHHLLAQAGVSEAGDLEDSICYDYGNLVSYMRARVMRDSKGNVRYAPFPEVPTRVAAQLFKLYQCAPLIFQTQKIPPIVHSLIARITADIICRQSPRYRICKALYIEPNQKGDEIITMTGLPPQQAEVEVADMLALNMLTLESHRTSTQHIIYKFSLRPDLYQQFERLEES